MGLLDVVRFSIYLVIYHDLMITISNIPNEEISISVACVSIDRLNPSRELHFHTGGKVIHNTTIWPLADSYIRLMG